MKYINKEYGFTFRPPFFDKFYEERETGPEMALENFPGKYIIGVGYDYSAINGAVFAGKNGSLWGIRVSYFNGKKWLDNDDFIQHLGIGCANTPDGSFAHFSSGPLSVKWARHSEQSLAVEISARKRLRVRAIFYPLYKWPGELSIEGNFVKGRSPYIGIIGGDITLTDTNAVFKGRYQAIMDETQGREYFMAQSYNKPADTANGAFNEVIMEFSINKNQPKIHIYASVGDESVLTAEAPRPDKIAKLIETSELRYGVNKTSGTGALGQSAENMLSSIMWSKIYYPYLLKVIYSPKRALLNNHFDISGTDENCAALLSAYIGNEGIEAQLGVTAEDKIMALLTVWHNFMHAPEGRDVYLGVFGKLKKLYPPDEDGLVTASGRTKLEVAYKWTDSPLKELNIEEDMYSLDLSCFRVLAFDIIERMAVWFGDPKAKQYRKARDKCIKLINDTLWYEEKGIYMNRYLKGTWPVSYGATSFYPLLAGAVDGSGKLSRLVNNLTDPRKFWGDFLVPTLSKDNEQYGRQGGFNSQGKRDPAYLQYRGSIIPYVNYLIYHGLVRYGLDQIAGEIAYKSVKLWRNNVNLNVENYSLYLPTGRRVKSREYFSNMGNMLALMGVQELIDIDYFRRDMKPGLRFGTFVRGNHSITNLKLLGRQYSLETGAGGTTLLMDNKNLFRAEGGRCIVRQFMPIKNGYEFLIDAQSSLSVNIYVYKNADNRNDYAVNFKVPQGKSKVIVENRSVTIIVIF